MRRTFSQSSRGLKRQQRRCYCLEHIALLMVKMVKMLLSGSLEEHKCKEHHTMKQTILPPVPPLGSNVNMIVNETSTSKSRIPSSKSLIIDGGSMKIVQLTQSTATTPRPVTSRQVSTSSQSLRNTNGQVASSSHYGSDNRFLEMMEMMESSNWQLFHHSYLDVLEDGDVMKARLVKASAENDSDSIQIFDDLSKKLFAVLQGCS